MNERFSFALRPPAAFPNEYRKLKRASTQINASSHFVPSMELSSRL